MRYRIVTNALKQMGLDYAETNAVVRILKLLQKPAFREAANRVIVILGGTPPSESEQYAVDIHVLRDNVLMLVFTGFGMPKVLYGSIERLPNSHLFAIYDGLYDTIVKGYPYSVRVRGGKDVLDQEALIEAFMQTEGLGVCSLRGNVATTVVADGFNPMERRDAFMKAFTQCCRERGIPLKIRTYDPH